MEQWGSTGVLEVLSACVALRPPVLCFPVANLVDLAPLTLQGGGIPHGGIPHGIPHGIPQGGGIPHGGTSGGGVEAPLRDCLQMRPLSSVGDVFLAAKRTHPPLCAAELRMFLPDGL